MQALLGLSRTEFVDRRYHGGTNLSNIASKFTSLEQWENHVNNINQQFPDGIPGMARDVKILCGVLENWQQVRELRSAGFLTSDAVRQIFATISRQKKTTLSELRMEDAKMFDYSEIEMRRFMASGVAIKTFSEEVGKAVDTALGIRAAG